MTRIFFLLLVYAFFSSCGTNKRFANEEEETAQEVWINKLTVKNLQEYRDTFFFDDFYTVTFPGSGNRYDAFVYTNEGILKGKYNSTNKQYADSLYTEYYPNGGVRFLATHKGSFQLTPADKNGIYLWFDTLGRMEKKETYYGGWLYGFSAHYYTNGNLKDSGNYVYSDSDGEWNYFDSLGRKEKTANYKDSALNGPYKEYYPDGKLKTEGWYYNNVKDKQWCYYSPTGKLIKTEKFNPKKTSNEYEKLYEIHDPRFESERLPKGEEMAKICFELGPEVLRVIEQLCRDKGMPLSDHKKIIKRLFLKYGSGDYFYYVYMNYDGETHLLERSYSVREFDYSFNTLGEAVSYFEIDYEITREKKW